MKIFFAYTLLLLATVGLSFGQTSNPSLDNDQNFKQALTRLIRYPETAKEAGQIARVYVDFKVDPQGRITDVSFFNKNKVDASFTEAVGQLMQQLPIQKPVYAGNYVLPVAFELDSQTGGVNRLTKADKAAYDRSFVQLLHTRSLLSEVTVTGYTK